jgi:hypothetical protein
VSVQSLDLGQHQSFDFARRKPAMQRFSDRAANAILEDLAPRLLTNLDRIRANR